MTTEWVGRVGEALRVIAPFAIDDETVQVFAGRKLYRCRPKTINAFLHGFRMPLPVSEVADQENGFGGGVMETEALSVFMIYSGCHIIERGPGALFQIRDCGKVGDYPM